MRRSTISSLAAYFGDLVALTGAAALAVDLVRAGASLDLRTIADLSLIGAGLCAHRATASRRREAPVLALAFLTVGAAPSVLLIHRWWMAVAAASATAAMAPHALPPRRARTWIIAATLLALTALVERVDLGGVAALGVLALGVLSLRFARDVRRRAALGTQQREQALLLERQRSADLLARLARFEGRAGSQHTSALRVALSRRLGTIGAIASSLAREFRQAAVGTGNAAPVAPRTIERVEQLARLATGGSPREQETTLSLVWPLVCDTVANRLQQAHHLDADIPADLPPLAGTALEWQHVLSAVLENALDAMPGGGVIRVRAGRSDRAGIARIVVEDTASGTARGGTDGAGRPLPGEAGAARADSLELATAGALLDVLGGEMQFSFLAARGARVTIESPFHGPASPAPAPAPGPAPALAGSTGEPMELRGTVLLADDDPDARRALTKLLRSYGLEVLEADNGTLALARLRNEPERFHAAVLDVVMEGIPIGEIVAGARERHPALPVLLVSGFDTRHFIDSVLALGGIRFLRKPIGRDELYHALRDLFALEAPPGD